MPKLQRGLKSRNVVTGPPRANGRLMCGSGSTWVTAANHGGELATQRRAVTIQRPPEFKANLIWSPIRPIPTN